MLRTPMHNRFVEGFSVSDSSGERIDPLSFRILDAAGSTTLQDARDARDASLAQWLARGAAWLRDTTDRLVLGSISAFLAWRQRERDAAELSALDDYALAELGISRAEIPYVLAHGPYERDTSGLEAPVSAPAPANSNYRSKDAA
jgi:uncharacterized protein YjiS (DUF1127 family)